MKEMRTGEIKKEPAPPERTGETDHSLNNLNKNITQNSEQVKSELPCNAVSERAKGMGGWATHVDFKSIFAKIKEPTIHFGWLVEQGVNFLVAKAGEGKSYLCMSAAIQLAKENPDMAVFYIDLDNPDWVAKMRGVPEAITENNIENFVYFVRNKDMEDATIEILKEKAIYEQFKAEYANNKLIAWIHVIKATIEKEKILIVFDSLQRFIDYNDYRQVADAFEVMERLKSKGYTFLVIHHKNKEGQQKGLQLLNDNADQFIYIKDVKKNEDNEIVEQTLDLDKARAGGKNIVNVKYVDLLTFVTMEDDIDYTKEEKLVIGIAISALKKQAKINQSELINVITSKVSVGEKKTRRILNKFEERLFIVQKGNKRTKLYSLNLNSKILGFFEEGKYTGTKKALLDTTIALIEAGEELTTPIEFELAGKVIKYDSLNAIRNNILSMKHEEAEEILEIISERYH